MPVTFFGLLAYRFNPTQVTDFAGRLKLTNAETETLLDAIALREEAAQPLATVQDLAPSAVFRLLEGYSDASLAIFALATDDTLVRERIELYRNRLQYVAPEITGDDLKKMGLEPGPAYRTILSRLRNARLDGEVSTREEEEQLVKLSLAQPLGNGGG
jgi:tRNA nucleotidyltransferase (CCA-adding enzyme)